MIHFKFTKKNVKRLVATMLLIAPIIYLFGSLFTGLNGAHGTQIFADGEETSQKSYDELMQVENFSFGSFDWTNEHGSRLGFSLGYVRVNSIDEFNEGLFFQSASYGVGYSGSSMNFGLGFSGLYSVESYLAFYTDSTPGVYLDESISANDCYTCFYIRSLFNTATDVGVCVLDWLGNATYYYCGASNSWSVTTDLDLGFSQFDIYFDDGAHLPAGVEWNDELRSYFVPTVKATEMQTFSDYVFGQFFARDNFVSDIGKDALSDDPHGFAPFAAMLKFVDENMLNIGSLQVGLMAYGYFYWCAHVLLLIVLFDLTTFFITWVSHIGDKFGGNADE